MKLSNKSPEGTSFFGSTILASYNQLCHALGGPPQSGGCGKSIHDWTCENEDEQIVTIYDWKEYRNFSNDEKVYFHIGGHSKKVTEKAKEKLEKILTK
jgi:hypothetical protein